MDDDDQDSEYKCGVKKITSIPPNDCIVTARLSTHVWRAIRQIPIHSTGDLTKTQSKEESTNSPISPTSTLHSLQYVQNPLPDRKVLIQSKTLSLLPTHLWLKTGDIFWMLNSDQTDSISRIQSHLDFKKDSESSNGELMNGPINGPSVIVSKFQVEDDQWIPLMPDFMGFESGLFMVIQTQKEIARVISIRVQDYQKLKEIQHLKQELIAKDPMEIASRIMESKHRSVTHLNPKLQHDADFDSKIRSNFAANEPIHEIHRNTLRFVAMVQENITHLSNHQHLSSL